MVVKTMRPPGPACDNIKARDAGSSRADDCAGCTLPLVRVFFERRPTCKGEPVRHQARAAATVVAAGLNQAHAAEAKRQLSSPALGSGRVVVEQSG